MPDQQNNAMQPAPQKKQGFWDRMGLFQKILIGAGIVLLVIVFILAIVGGIGDFYTFIFYVIIAIVILGGLYIVVQMTGEIFQPVYYSPRKDLRQTLTKMAIFYCPDNLNNLYFTGSDWKKRVLAGKIIGCMGLPYYSGKMARYKKNVFELNTEGKKVLKHKQGDIIFTELKDSEGTKIPQYEDVTFTKDGDTFFVVQKGWFIFKQTELIRAHHSYHGELVGDVDLYDINPVPFGIFRYPYKQMQAHVEQVMVQNHIETIIMTHEHQMDFVSTGVDAAAFFNPHMQFMLKSQAEQSSDEK